MAITSFPRIYFIELRVFAMASDNEKLWLRFCAAHAGTYPSGNKQREQKAASAAWKLVKGSGKAAVLNSV